MGMKELKNKECKHCKVMYKPWSHLQSYCTVKCKSDAYKQRNKGKPRKSNYIPKVSNRNSYFTSRGIKQSSAAIDRLISKAKAIKIEEMENEFGYIFCEDCAKEIPKDKDLNDMDLKIIDCSHEISVDECKKSGRVELAYSVENIIMRCRYHHRKHDKTE